MERKQSFSEYDNFQVIFTLRRRSQFESNWPETRTHFIPKSDNLSVNSRIFSCLIQINEKHWFRRNYILFNGAKSCHLHESKQHFERKTRCSISTAKLPSQMQIGHANVTSFFLFIFFSWLLQAFCSNFLRSILYSKQEYHSFLCSIALDVSLLN